MKNKICKRHNTQKVFKKYSKSFMCMKCKSDQVKEWRRNYKKRLMQVFGNECELCGYNKCPRNLEFHHLDPKTKSFGLAYKGRIISFERGLKEARKCVLVCSNCHGEIEARIREVPQYFFDRAKQLHCSSVVEQPSVKRKVIGSIPICAAKPS